MSKTILVVDDSRITRRIQIRMLGMIGVEHTTLEAGDGLEAQEVMEGNPGVDLILCDLNMPRQNGVEFLTEVRKEDTDLPIVIVTSDHSLLRRMELLKAGASAYLTKPVSPEALRDAVTSLLAA